MTVDRLAAPIDDPDAACAAHFASAMDSVRDLLDGSNGGYVAPQNRWVRPDWDPTPLTRTAVIEFNPAVTAVSRGIGQTIERGLQQMADTLKRGRMHP